MPDPTPPPVPTGFGAADTADEALLTGAEWDALGRAVVPTWDDETSSLKKIWRGFRMDLALGYRVGLAAGRTAAAAARRDEVIKRWREREWAESEVSLLLHADDMRECEHDIHGNPHACYQDKTDALMEKLVAMGWTPPDVPYTVAELDAAARIAEASNHAE